MHFWNTLKAFSQKNKSKYFQIKNFVLKKNIFKHGKVPIIVLLWELDTK